GVSCMFCHARGLIDKSDQIRQHVDKNPAAFSEEGTRSVRALYLPEPAFKSLLDKDRERFLQAVVATGTRPGQTEPVAALAARFELELNLPMAAAELGLQPAALSSALERSGQLGQRLGALKVQGGTVQRQVFVLAFPEVLDALHLGASLAALNR